MYEPRHEKTGFFANAKTKAVTAKLSSAFVFASRVVQFILFLLPKFQAFHDSSGTMQASLSRTGSESTHLDQVSRVAAYVIIE